MQHFRMHTKESIWLAKVAEAAAMLEAMRWVIFLGYQHVVFEGDSQTVMHALEGTYEDLTEFVEIIRMCWGLFRA